MNSNIKSGVSFSFLSFSVMSVFYVTHGHRRGKKEKNNCRNAGINRRSRRSEIGDERERIGQRVEMSVKENCNHGNCHSLLQALQDVTTSLSYSVSGNWTTSNPNLFLCPYPSYLHVVLLF